MITQSRFFFKFIVIFFLLLIFPVSFAIFPFVSFISDWITEFYHVAIPWVAANILSLEKEITVFTSGSGDTTYDYVLILCLICLSGLGAILWTLLDTKKIDHQPLNAFLLVLLRYYLAYNMFSYGFYKVFPLQFSEPSFNRLLQPYGDSSPMGLAWTFMGYSSSYTTFAGISEVLGGLLLLHRRTTILGALVTCGVMLNVFMMNMCYDIPVKIFSFQLLLMAFLILLSDKDRLLSVFLWNKPTTSKAFEPYFKTTRQRQLGKVVKSIIVLFFLYTHVSDALEARNDPSYGYAAPSPPLYGLYNVKDYVVNQDTIPPLLTDSSRWRRLVIEHREIAQIYYMNHKAYYKITIDSLAKTIDFVNYYDTTEIGKFEFYDTDSTMLLEGVLGADSISCTMDRLNKEDFKLMSRKFNWIQEYPYNR